MTPQAALDLIFGWIAKLTGWGLILLAAAVTAQALGVKIPMIPALNPITLCYIGGFWYLIRK